MNLLHHLYLIVSKVLNRLLLCYLSIKNIRYIIFNFNKLVSDLDIDANTSDS